MSSDPLMPLLDLPGVADAAAEAREAIDRLLGHRVLRRQSGPVSAESALRGARASAELEGAAYDLETVRGGAVTDAAVQGALRVAAGLGPLVDTWPLAPRQVLARLHALAATDVVPADSLGRPSGDPAVSARLDALAALVSAPVGEGGTAAPAVVVAAIVHGELLSMRPFGGADGLVARAAGRLTLVARGLDPKSVSVPEAGHLARQPEYQGSLGAYATGTPDGVRSWLRHYGTAVALGAEEGLAICDAMAA
ncbi:MAG TPA: oxidoreductase [Mycobacteriales bacterium]